MQNLMRALADAQKSIGGVEKDARNKHHGYDYSSAEGIIADSRTALLRHGIIADRTSWTMNDLPDGTRSVTSRFLLWHIGSGEHLATDSPWPVIPEKGRPLDKALAGALTTSLAYWLRDTLLLPRGIEGEILTDAREDHRAVENEPPRAVAPERRSEPEPQRKPESNRPEPASKGTIDAEGHSNSFLKIMDLMDELGKLEPSRSVLDRAEKIPLMAAEAADTNELGRQEEIDIQQRYNPFVRSIREALGVAK